MNTGKAENVKGNRDDNRVRMREREMPDGGRWIKGFRRVRGIDKGEETQFCRSSQTPV